jgi:hypothetical protein
MTRHLASACAAALLLIAVPVSAQNKASVTGVPEIPFTSVPNFLKLPPGEYLGESVAVATNSKGYIYVYHRSAPTTKLWEFDANGNFRREIGKGYYGFEFAHSVRIDKDDNIWTVDEGTNMVTDVGFDPQGNIFVSDGYCNNRVVKYSPEGRFLAKSGSEKNGKALGEFFLPHGLQVDGNGHVWVADRTNFRYQELDNNLKPIREFTNIGVGWTICISQGPHQYVFASNSNPNGNAPGTWDITGEIYKMELDGTIIGKFGRPGKVVPGFQVVHMMDCRNPNEIILGEIESWRVQKYILGQPQASNSTIKAAAAQ